jgi:pimeloyl-ACP methyl ester carboxylesterase
MSEATPTVVLVHGAFADASSWSGVIERLQATGITVTAPANPLRGISFDSAYLASVFEQIEGPVLAVGHSYGGAVITNVGRSGLVKGLVYVAAFAPDEGETVNGIVERYPPAEVSKYMRRGPDGEWASEHTDEYWDEIGWDVPEDQRAVWDAESRPSDNRIFSEPTGVPAWRSKPSWYLVAAEDKTLPTVIQRDMAARAGAITSEVPGSHFTPRVRPADVLKVIEQALDAL